MGASLERSEPVRGATWDDFDAVVALLVEQSRASTGLGGTRAESIRIDWQQPGFTVGKDNWLAGAAGYAAVSPTGALVLTAPDVATAQRLFARASTRARKRGLTKLRLIPVEGDARHAALIRDHRFTRELEVLRMWRPLARSEEEPSWPPGVGVRTFQPPDAHGVHALLDEAYGDWDRTYVSLAHDDWERRMTGDVEFDPTTWWLAERHGALVGCALWWSSGWLKDIAVRKSERRNGLGAALLQQGFVEFARRDKRHVGLKVDAANPTGAQRLYETHGFRIERREQIWVSSL
jgi:ribosomal protein S18 acetylase RimI-like enzyme